MNVYKKIAAVKSVIFSIKPISFVYTTNNVLRTMRTINFLSIYNLLFIVLLLSSICLFHTTLSLTINSEIDNYILYFDEWRFDWDHLNDFDVYNP